MYFIFYFSAKILEMAVRRVLVLYEEKTKGEMRKLLVRMLRSLRSVPYKSTQSSKIDAEKLPLFEIFVRMFLDEVFFIVRNGA